MSVDIIEKEISELNEKYGHLVSTLDTFLKRLDDIKQIMQPEMHSLPDLNVGLSKWQLKQALSWNTD